MTVEKMGYYCASLETHEHGTHLYGFHLGTNLRKAKAAAEELIHLTRISRVDEPVRIRTVGLKLDGVLVDVFEGDEWASARDKGDEE